MLGAYKLRRQKTAFHQRDQTGGVKGPSIDPFWLHHIPRSFTETGPRISPDSAVHGWSSATCRELVFIYISMQMTLGAMEPGVSLCSNQTKLFKFNQTDDALSMQSPHWSFQLTCKYVGLRFSCCKTSCIKHFTDDPTSMCTASALFHASQKH